MERDRHLNSRHSDGHQLGSERTGSRPWRPGETVLSPEDLRRVRTLQQIRDLQAGIADMNLALWRIVRQRA